MMNKFQKKAFECEMYGELYDYLENRCHNYMQFDNDSGEYVPYDSSDANYTWERERAEIIRKIMEKVEKMI